MISVQGSPPGKLADPDKRLLVCTGRGGTGKTTCAVATALALAELRPTQTIVLLSIDPAHSVRDSLAGATSPANLVVNELHALQRHQQFRGKYDQTLAEIARRGTFLDEGDIQQFLDLPLPGIDELMAVLALADLIEDTSISTIVLDTAPGGHTLRMLASPELLDRWFAALDSLLAKYRYMHKVFRGRYTPDHTDQLIEDLQGRCHTVAALLRSDACCFALTVMAQTNALGDALALVDSLAAHGVATDPVIINRVWVAGGCTHCTGLAGAEQAAVAQAPRLLEGRSVFSLPRLPCEPRGNHLKTFWAHATPWTPRPLNPDKSPRKTEVTHGASVELGTHELVLVAGKGGVGKSTIACATALAMAKRPDVGLVTLLSTDPSPALASLLQRDVGPSPTLICDGLVARTVDSAGEWERWRESFQQEMHDSLGHSSGLDLAFDGQVLEHLLDISPPGLDEIIAITKILPSCLTEPRSMVVMDTAATGHFLRLLQLPELLTTWVRTLFSVLLKYRSTLRLPHLSDQLIALSRQLKQFRKRLCDATRTQLLLITVPTEVAHAEAVRLRDDCQKLSIALASVVVNHVTPANPDCPSCQAFVREEAEILRRWSQGPTPRIHITHGAAPIGRAALSELGSNLWPTTSMT